jgi:hypothetical protein
MAACPRWRLTAVTLGAPAPLRNLDAHSCMPVPTYPQRHGSTHCNIYYLCLPCNCMRDEHIFYSLPYEASFLFRQTNLSAALLLLVNRSIIDLPATAVSTLKGDSHRFTVFRHDSRFDPITLFACLRAASDV